ncbi:hypothetical protein FIBSPDRAFT_37324 [Athelia psychrophila]|uniref:Uncharacterized protein n=1 Tax=Athelia psychrophila TaxID=1759441 RepID=A0A166FP75_9AGAM|nr:hypothetical protein FIBSPDRAFT_37324 [Fibularhizoctonia sp. CBS 109695]
MPVACRFVAASLKYLCCARGMLFTFLPFSAGAHSYSKILPCYTNSLPLLDIAPLDFLVTHPPPICCKLFLYVLVRPRPYSKPIYQVCEARALRVSVALLLVRLARHRRHGSQFKNSSRG